jgi:ABC-type arginine transport system permease subunit
MLPKATVVRVVIAHRSNYLARCQYRLLRIASHKYDQLRFLPRLLYRLSLFFHVQHLLTGLLFNEQLKGRGTSYA